MDNFSEKPTLCKDCNHLRYGEWEFEPEITDVGIASGPNDFCNSKCIYCVKYPKASDDEILNRQKYILDVIKYFFTKANGNPLTLHINAGEVSVSSYCDEVMRLIADNENLRVYFSTNAIVYKQSIADCLTTGRASIIISPDSGTPETITKVRGFDCFDRTISNTVKYAGYLADKTMLSLKYIILEGINDNETDIQNFLDIVKSVGCTALLSANLLCVGKTCLSKHGLDMCRFFMRICRDYDLTFRYVDYYFNEKDRRAIEEYKHSLQLLK